jgi:hypothetical protein
MQTVVPLYNNKDRLDIQHKDRLDIQRRISLERAQRACFPNPICLLAGKEAAPCGAAPIGLAGRCRLGVLGLGLADDDLGAVERQIVEPRVERRGAELQR